MRGLPFVGGNLGRLAKEIGATAGSAQANSSAAKSSVDQLAYLLGIVVVVVPSVPALAAYLPFRIGRVREVRANRALANLPYHQLTALSHDPWGDAEQGRLDALAGAELRRLGLDSERFHAGAHVSSS